MLIADKYLRTCPRVSYLGCVLSVLSSIGSDDVLGLGEHISDTIVGIANHSTALIRNIVKNFYNLHQHHTAKLRTLRIQGPYIRHQNTKITLFSGQ
jgi:hypothetical protein